MYGWPAGPTASATASPSRAKPERWSAPADRASPGFVCQADLLILDEPFRELDPESENRILEHLQNFAGSGRMIVLITHHAGSRRFATQSIHLHGICDKNTAGADTRFPRAEAEQYPASNNSCNRSAKPARIYRLS